MRNTYHPQINGKRASGLLTRLLRDKAGNTLYIIALALFPLTAMVGAGVDMGRAYMVRARLQAACDAGALATRKSLATTSLGTNTIDSAALAQGRAFFANNFPDGKYGTTRTGTPSGSNVGPITPTLDSNNQVNLTVTSTMPYALMQIFGNTTQAITLTCASKLDLANTDVMFVLDNTGSMNDCPDNTTLGNTQGGGLGTCTTSNNKIAGLKTAVDNFYDKVDAAASGSGAIMRFGFVPYAMSVNVGGLLYATNPAYITDVHGNNTTPGYASVQGSVAGYSSVAANMTTPVYAAVDGAPVTGTQSYGGLSSNQCNKYGVNNLGGGTNGPYQTGGPPPASTTRYSYSYKSYSSGTCSRWVTTVVSTYSSTPSGYTFSGWTFGKTTYDTSVFKQYGSGSVTIATPDLQSSLPASVTAPVSGTYNLAQIATLSGYSSGTTSTSWDGCVEEPDTVAQATFTPIPANAYDMQVDLVPGSGDVKQWRPKWPQIVWDGVNYNQPSQIYYSCPQGKVKNLLAMSGTAGRTALNTYLNTLTPNGGTYHDSGMIWGGRLISPTGLFATLNTGTSFPAQGGGTVTNGYPISSRHIILMTDGFMCAGTDQDGMWGYEALDQRVLGGTSNSGSQNCVDGSSYDTLNSRHNNRFVAICNAIKAKGITIWTINFGTGSGSGVISTLQQCSTNNGSSSDNSHAFFAADTAALNATFTNIATQISLLKLTQ
jgi:Flp pilus assembly protein TadG